MTPSSTAEGYELTKMATGLSNKLTSQIGEYLCCAELGRHGLIATTFTGNVPDFDLLVCDSNLVTEPVQVKTSRSNSWPSKANFWLNIEIDDKNKQQINLGERDISNPTLIYICVVLGSDRSGDRFFICQKKDIQTACITSYCRWMDSKDWKRPRNYRSLDNRYYMDDLLPFENNWKLITDRLQRNAS
jgi:hypothetical protein